MLKIDNSLLTEVGLGGLPAAEKNSFLKHIYETLEMRVGIRLADQMSNEQLDEFERYFEAKDDAGAFKWLETNFPNYKEIVQQEFDKLKGEVAQSAPQILAASAGQQAGGQAPQAAPAVAAPAVGDVGGPVPSSPSQAQPHQPPAQQPYVPAPAPVTAQPIAQPPQPQQGHHQAAPHHGQPQPYQQPQPPQMQPPAVAPTEPPYPSQQPPAGPAVS